jgi:hypothetical protein
MRQQRCTQGTIVSKTFRQDFPFIGLVADIQTKANANAAQESNTTWTYGTDGSKNTDPVCF